MNEFIIVAVLFAPVLIILIVSRIARLRSKKKRAATMLLFLQNNYPSLNQHNRKLIWLNQQLLALFPEEKQAVIIEAEGPHPDAVLIDLKQVKKIALFKDIEEVKLEGKGAGIDRVVMRMGLCVSYKEEQQELVFFDYKVEHTSLLAEKEAAALQLQQEIQNLSKES